MKIKIKDKDNALQELLDRYYDDLEESDCYDIALINIDHYGISILNQYDQKKVIPIIETVEHLNALLDKGFTSIITRPFIELDVLKVFQKRRSYFVDSFTIKSQYHNLTILYEDVVYMASNGRKLQIYGKGGMICDIYYKLDDMEKMLPDHFVRTHQSFLINLHYIQSYDRNEIIMKYVDTPIFISKSKKHQLLEILQKRS